MAQQPSATTGTTTPQTNTTPSTPKAPTAPKAPTSSPTPKYDTAYQNSYFQRRMNQHMQNDLRTRSPEQLQQQLDRDVARGRLTQQQSTQIMNQFNTYRNEGYYNGDTYMSPQDFELDDSIREFSNLTFDNNEQPSTVSSTGAWENGKWVSPQELNKRQEYQSLDPYALPEGAAIFQDKKGTPDTQKKNYDDFRTSMNTTLMTKSPEEFKAELDMAQHEGKISSTQAYNLINDFNHKRNNSGTYIGANHYSTDELKQNTARFQNTQPNDVFGTAGPGAQMFAGSDTYEEPATTTGHWINGQLLTDTQFQNYQNKLVDDQIQADNMVYNDTRIRKGGKPPKPLEWQADRDNAANSQEKQYAVREQAVQEARANRDLARKQHEMYTTLNPTEESPQEEMRRLRRQIAARGARLGASEFPGAGATDEDLSNLMDTNEQWINNYGQRNRMNSTALAQRNDLRRLRQLETGGQENGPDSTVQSAPRSTYSGNNQKIYNRLRALNPQAVQGVTNDEQLRVAASNYANQYGARNASNPKFMTIQKWLRTQG